MTKHCSQLEAGFTLRAGGLCRSRQALFSTHPPALVSRPSLCPARQKRDSPRACCFGASRKGSGKPRESLRGLQGDQGTGEPSRNGASPWENSEGGEQVLSSSGNRDLLGLEGELRGRERNRTRGTLSARQLPGSLGDPRVGGSLQALRKPLENHRVAGVLSRHLCWQRRVASCSPGTSVPGHKGQVPGGRCSATENTAWLAVGRKDGKIRTAQGEAVGAQAHEGGNSLSEDAGLGTTGIFTCFPS